jgi:hypothetical protein
VTVVYGVGGRYHRVGHRRYRGSVSKYEDGGKQDERIPSVPGAAVEEAAVIAELCPAPYIIRTVRTTASVSRLGIGIY